MEDNNKGPQATGSSAPNQNPGQQNQNSQREAGKTPYGSEKQDISGANRQSQDIENKEERTSYGSNKSEIEGSNRQSQDIEGRKEERTPSSERSSEFEDRSSRESKGPKASENPNQDLGAE